MKLTKTFSITKAILFNTAWLVIFAAQIPAFKAVEKPENLTSASDLASRKNMVKISLAPPLPLIELGKTLQYLNFDLIAKNLTGEKLSLSSIEVSVFDAQNRLLLIKEINQNGVRPSIETIPLRELEPNGNLLIFNPFHEFEKNWQIKKLNYLFTFQNAERTKNFTATATVSPLVYVTKTHLMVPLKGTILNWDGHDYLAHHRRWDFLHPILQKYGYQANASRYSYDFCITQKDGSLYQGKFENNSDWYSFGQNVYAAGKGRVVSVIDDMPDNRNFPMDKLAENLMIQFGNQIIIDHGNGEFSLFAHLKQGSVQVKVGDKVEQNQLIAQIGASGSANFPHLHYELRNGAGGNAEGLPSYFYNYRQILGSQTLEIKKGLVETGEIIER